MPNWVINVPVEPVAKGRPRGAVVAGRVRMYTPSKTSQYERLISFHAGQLLPATVLDEPLRIDIVAIMRRPKRLLRKKDPEGLVPCPTRPDLDNIRKAVMDALSPHYRDDSLVCVGETHKFFAEKSGKPRLYVRISTIDDISAPDWCDAAQVG